MLRCCIRRRLHLFRIKLYSLKKWIKSTSIPNPTVGDVDATLMMMCVNEHASTLPVSTRDESLDTLGVSLSTDLAQASIDSDVPFAK